jgi:phosphoglycerol transferase MdoB-like AlkP superfamily enzyme
MVINSIKPSYSLSLILSCSLSLISLWVRFLSLEVPFLFLQVIHVIMIILAGFFFVQQMQHPISFIWLIPSGSLSTTQHLSPPAGPRSQIPSMDCGAISTTSHPNMNKWPSTTGMTLISDFLHLFPTIL